MIRLVAPIRTIVSNRLSLNALDAKLTCCGMARCASATASTVPVCGARGFCSPGGSCSPIMAFVASGIVRPVASGMVRGLAAAAAGGGGDGARRRFDPFPCPSPPTRVPAAASARAEAICLTLPGFHVAAQGHQPLSQAASPSTVTAALSTRSGGLRFLPSSYNTPSLYRSSAWCAELAGRRIPTLPANIVAFVFSNWPRPSLL
eukprot:COSAG06_NODE_1168_length_10444_cov_60.207347_8_plen_204_part_00